MMSLFLGEASRVSGWRRARVRERERRAAAASRLLIGPSEARAAGRRPWRLGGKLARRPRGEKPRSQRRAALLGRPAACERGGIKEAA